MTALFNTGSSFVLNFKMPHWYLLGYRVFAHNANPTTANIATVGTTLFSGAFGSIDGGSSNYVTPTAWQTSSYLSNSTASTPIPAPENSYLEGPDGTPASSTDFLIDDADLDLLFGKNLYIAIGVASKNQNRALQRVPADPFSISAKTYDLDDTTVKASTNSFWDNTIADYKGWAVAANPTVTVPGGYTSVPSPTNTIFAGTNVAELYFSLPAGNQTTPNNLTIGKIEIICSV